MISHEDYLKAKLIVEEYEDQEYRQGMQDAMYCTCCDAMHEQECICSFLSECQFCGGENGEHNLSCPDNESPYAQLIRDGYD